MLYYSSRTKISIITDVSILGFYEYSGNIDEYFNKNIGKTKINKNTLKLMKKNTIYFVGNIENRK